MNSENKLELYDKLSIKSSEKEVAVEICNGILKQSIENNGIIHLQEVFKQIEEDFPDHTYKKFHRFIIRMCVNTKEFLIKKKGIPLFYQLNEDTICIIPKNSKICEDICAFKYELLYKDEFQIHEIKQAINNYLDEIEDDIFEETDCSEYINRFREFYINEKRTFFAYRLFSKIIIEIADMLYEDKHYKDIVESVDNHDDTSQKVKDLQQEIKNKDEYIRELELQLKQQQEKSIEVHKELEHMKLRDIELNKKIDAYQDLNEIFKNIDYEEVIEELSNRNKEIKSKFKTFIDSIEINHSDNNNIYDNWMKWIEKEEDVMDEVIKKIIYDESIDKENIFSLEEISDNLYQRYLLSHLLLHLMHKLMSSKHWSQVFLQE